MGKLGDEFVGLFRDFAENDSVDMRRLEVLGRNLTTMEIRTLQSQSIMDGPNSLGSDV